MLHKKVVFYFLSLHLFLQLSPERYIETCVGSHAGVSIGEDGPSQMALEDLAMFRSIPGMLHVIRFWKYESNRFSWLNFVGSTVFYPSDAVSCERAAEMAGKTKGICFIRTSRPNTAVIYENNKEFQIGKGSVVRSHDQDDLVIVGAGVTLHEACVGSHLSLSRPSITICCYKKLNVAKAVF